MVQDKSSSSAVCGKTFHAPEYCKSSQEAQNEAAKLAYHHFSTASSKKPLNRPAKIRRLDSPSPPISNSSPAAVIADHSPEPAILQHKNQLQIYAQKRKLNLPTYSYVREGPPHNVRCKAMVTVDGQTFESPEFCRTQKDAEHAASRVSLESLMRAGILEDESAGFSKNFLQEFLMKGGLPLPIYKTKSCGAPHLPTFLCTAQVGTDVFEGIAARTKKQAGMNAAKVAYCQLKERKLSATMISGGKDTLQCTSSNSSLNQDLQMNVKSEDRLATPPAQESKKEWKDSLLASSYNIFMDFMQDIGSYKDANLAKPVDKGQFSSPPSVGSSFKPGVTQITKNKAPGAIDARLQDIGSQKDANLTKPVYRGQFRSPPSVASSFKPGVPSIARNKAPGVLDARPQVPLPFSLSSADVCVNCSLSPVHQGRCARHSPLPSIPSTEEIAELAKKMLAVWESNILWTNQDYGSKPVIEVMLALTNMVKAAKILLEELAIAKWEIHMMSH
ncbi:uncharacterized protein LOC113360581 [Papaver somniferum]|uniref:uncharacterized protein LOC113360581 n=1 Tax=Papaver somniferum TaxID=3469 RepID=UPI000E705DD1|nr:uncharacterized protein LOC113360581 [Papaver somniferum]